MTDAITAEAAFEALADRLELSWIAGKTGRKRAIEPTDNDEMRPSLTGFLNLVHPNDIQVLGAEELSYLDALDSRKRWETIAEIYGNRPVAIVIGEGLQATDDLLEGANESSTPLWITPLTSVQLVAHLQHFLARSLAHTVTLHGVFIEVFSIGVLLTGDSGSGKSELALELITRGHRLVADDAPEMTRIAPDVIDGTCPELLRDCLEVRGLGILNVREMFGESAVKSNKYLRLIIHLDLTYQGDSTALQQLNRLTGTEETHNVLGMDIPLITIPVAPGRNMAVIVEAAVRNHSLKMKGYDAAKAFLQRHEDTMRRQARNRPLDGGRS